MFDHIMVCLVRKGLQEFVDGTDASSQLHAPCSQQSVTVGLVKIPNMFKNKKIAKGQKSFLFRRMKNNFLSFF